MPLQILDQFGGNYELLLFDKWMPPKFLWEPSNSTKPAKLALSGSLTCLPQERPKIPRPAGGFQL